MERLQAQELMCVNVLHVAARVDVLYVAVVMFSEGLLG